MGRARITLDLDDRLLGAVDSEAASLGESRNRFIVSALERTLREIERRRVDAEFAAMADDPDYQAELLRVDREWSPASDAAWRMLDAAEASRDAAR